MAEKKMDIKVARYGHNDRAERSFSKITYMAHAKGYVMARRPGCIPFVISEKLWCSFPAWNGLWHGER